MTACNCTHCQKQSGSALSIIARVPREALTVTGVLTDFHDTAESGAPVIRRFCGKCGSYHVIPACFIADIVAQRIDDRCLAACGFGNELCDIGGNNLSAAGGKQFRLRRTHSTRRPSDYGNLAGQRFHIRLSPVCLRPLASALTLPFLTLAIWPAEAIVVRTGKIGIKVDVHALDQAFGIEAEDRAEPAT